VEAREAHKRADELAGKARGAGRRLEGARLELTQYLSARAAGATKPDQARERQLRDELAAIQARTTSVPYSMNGEQRGYRLVDFEADAVTEAARLAAGDADAEVGAFVAERRDELAGELRDRAEAARDGLIEAVEAVSRAHGEWRTVRTAWVDVLGVSPAEVPAPPLPLGDVELIVAQVEGGAKDPRGLLPAPVEPVEGEEQAPAPGALRGWAHVPLVVSSAGGLGA
jgi:hypothetical protein